MLLQFCVRNHKSFADEACLSLVPSNLKEDLEPISIPGTKYKSVPVALIYGANASGKTNLIDAMKYMKFVVRNSHSRWEPNSNIPRAPFKLSQKYIDSTSMCALDFVVDGVLYNYGFEASTSSFSSEWLYAYPKGARQVWFERDDKGISTGKNLKGSVSTIKSITRRNSLFLSAAAQNNHDQLTPIYNFFSRLEFTGDIFQPGRSINVDVEKIGKIVEFLKFADIGIVDAKIEKESASDDMKEILKSLDSAMEKIRRRHERPSRKRKPRNDDLRLSDIDSVDKVSFAHRTTDNQKVYLDLEEESAGTIRLANLLAPVLSVLEESGVLVIDELDASLHSLLAEKIIEIFADPEINDRGSQLIAATQDTNLLCSKYLRRDQIWFVEKNSDGESVLFPLTEFSTRRTDNLEKGYLDGRFGAIPFLGSVRRIREKILTGISDGQT